MTHISNNLAVRLNIGALQREGGENARPWRLQRCTPVHLEVGQPPRTFLRQRPGRRGDGITLKQRNPSLAAAAKSQPMVFTDRSGALRNHRVFANSPFQFAVPSDFSSTPSLICFPSSYLSPSLFTYLFQPLSARS